MPFTIGGINLGNLPNYLFFFDNGSTDANWQGATKGFVGNVAVNGLVASERTSGSVPYAGILTTNAATQGAWQAILNQNLTQSSGVTSAIVTISDLQSDLISAIQQINTLSPTPGFASVSSTSLNGLNTQNGINEVFVINITSGLNFSSEINITGDAGDVFILRWDTDGNPSNGYQGQVKPQSGGAIVPLGGLTPANFINVCGDLTSSGGGSTPAPPYPQGPRFNNGQGALIIGGSDFSGGGFFTGYWLTTGAPTTFDPLTGLYFGDTSPLSNGIFVGGWYTFTTKFSMTSGTSGVYVSPNQATLLSADISVVKTASPSPVTAGQLLTYTLQVANAGPDAAQNVTLTDNVPSTLSGVQFSIDGGVTYNPWISPYTIGTLANGASETILIRGTVNATATGNITNTATVSSTTPDPNPGNNTSTVITPVINTTPRGILLFN